MKGLSDSVVAMIIVIAAVVATLVIVTLTFNFLQISSSLQVTALPTAKVWKVGSGSYNITFTLKNTGIETSIVSIYINDQKVNIVSYYPSYFPKVPPGQTTYVLEVDNITLYD
ncbi:MAG: hypothetical protein QXV69_06405 [Sulfolobaceae archaeon]